MNGHGIAPPGFRLPEDTRVGAVRLQVANLDRSIAFYEQVLGLRVQARDRDHATLGADATGAPLVRLHERAGIAPAPRPGAFGLYHFAVLLPSRADLGRLLVHLARLGVRVASADHLVSEALYFGDPDGLGIEVYADRPREAWQSRDRELVMTTEPLDLADLAAGGGDAPWMAAPPETTMGHVHLHVGDLGAARRFYHDALGLDVMVWSYPGALFLAAGGYHHHLGVNTWSPGPAATDAHARLLDWELVVPRATDRAAAAASLAAAPAVTAEGAAITACDPWGTQLRIVGEPGTA